MTDLTKTCTKCKEAKPLALFSRDARLKDGLQRQCKECNAEYRKANVEQIVEYRKANAEQRAKSQAEYRKVNAEQIAKREAEYRKANAEQIAEYFAEYRKANAEQIAKRMAEYRKANAEQLVKSQAEYRKANAEQIAKRMAEYRKANAEQIAEYFAEYRKVNAEQRAKSTAAYCKANRSIMNAQKAKRKATKLQATPSWLNKSHLKQIQLVYAEAKLLSDRGFKHHVDHIVPLQGKTVSGLHVPWNLRAIPASANLSKSNATPDTLPSVRYF